MLGLHDPNQLRSHHSKAGLPLLHSTVESARDQKITKWARSDILLDGRGSEQPGNAKISSEAEQGCKA